MGEKIRVSDSVGAVPFSDGACPLWVIQVFYFPTTRDSLCFVYWSTSTTRLLFFFELVEQTVRFVLSVTRTSISSFDPFFVGSIFLFQCSKSVFLFVGSKSPGKLERGR